MYRGLEAVGTWLSGEITFVNNTKKRGRISWGGESRHLKASSQSLPTMRLIPKRLILNSKCEKKNRNSFLFLFYMRGRVKDTSSDEQKDDLTNGSTSSDEQKDDLTNGSKEEAT